MNDPNVVDLANGGLDENQVYRIMRSPFGQRYLPGIADRLVVHSDAVVASYDPGDGSMLWSHLGPIFPLRDPNVGRVWTPSGTAPTVVDQTKGVITIAVDGTSSNHCAFLSTPLPSPPYTITAVVLASLIPGSVGATGMGIGLLDSIGSGLITFHAGAGSPQNFVCPRLLRWTNQTTVFSDYVTATRAPWTGAVMMRITDDNTNRQFLTSSDGINFGLLFSVSRTDFITPNSLIVSADAGAAVGSGRVGGTLVGLKITAGVANAQGADW